MTIHSAKGLEWPVVIVPDLSRVPPSFSPGLLFDPELGVGLDFGDEVGKDADPPVVHRVIKERLAHKREEEDKRLFYVALTRARDHLVLTTTDANTQRACGMTLLRPGLEAAGVEAATVW
jgi:ATP-dependent helicase/nuclease subunit A